MIFIHVFTHSPYNGKWSKSMVGYGDEDSHFVMELTYNYGIGEYRLGNDFQVCNLTLSTGVLNRRPASAFHTAREELLLKN